MNYIIRLIFSGVLVMLLGLSGCKQDIENTSWDVDILAPVIHTKLTMADLLADSLLQADSEGALRLIVETPLIDLPLDSILKIPDTTVTTPIGSPVALIDVQPGFELPALTDFTHYDLGDLALKEVVLKTGKLLLKAKSILGTEVDFRYLISGATLNGNMFETERTVPEGSETDTAFVEFEFDLSGYRIDLRGSNGSAFNTLETTFILKISEQGNVISTPGNNIPFFFLEYSFVDIVPSFGTGYFGQESSSVEDENSDIDVLNRITSGQMFLDSVSIGLKLINGVGADAQFKLSQLQSINNRTNSTINLDGEIVGSNILLTRAQDMNGTAEGVATNEINFHLNNGNSNIKEFVENLPDQLGFTFDFKLNPLGDISAGNDFFYYDRPFQAIMAIDIPLRTKLENLTLVDTLDWDLSQGGTVESINSGSFTLVAKNGFPLEGLIELVLLDEALEVLDTLIVPSMIAAPPLDANRKVIAPLESRILIPLPDKSAGALARTKSVRIEVRFNTAGQPDLVEFYDTYGIDLKLIGDINISFGASVF